jgi:hypothetical protein
MSKELEQRLREAEASGGPVPREVEEARAAAASRGVCCRYYSGGKYNYDWTSSAQECTSFPIMGTVVSDSYCQR